MPFASCLEFGGLGDNRGNAAAFRPMALDCLHMGSKQSFIVRPAFTGKDGYVAGRINGMGPDNLPARDTQLVQAGQVRRTNGTEAFGFGRRHREEFGGATAAPTARARGA